MVVDLIKDLFVDNALLVSIVLFSIIAIIVVKLLQNRKFKKDLEAKNKMEEKDSKVVKNEDVVKVREDPSKINLSKDDSISFEPRKEEVVFLDVDALREEKHKEESDNVFPSFNEEKTLKNTQFSGEENILRSIKSVGEIMAKENKALDEAMKNDHESLNKELVSIKEKKELVKKYGLALGKLFEKYGEREGQLSLQINNIKRLLTPHNKE